MSDNRPTLPPGAMSVEATQWIKEAFATPVPEGLSFSKQRRLILEMQRPVSEAAMEAHTVSTEDTIIAGVPCMIILPPEQKNDRTILYNFGGGFTVGSPFEDLMITAALAAKCQTKVIAPNYRRA